VIPVPHLSGTFIINGVPTGTIHLRASADGYQPSEQDVTYTLFGGPAAANFQLQRQ
jgi:hypothetical protein